jgi:hypothetical protein
LPFECKPAALQRGAELCRLMIATLGDDEAAVALVALEEPGRVTGVGQFILPYYSRSVAGLCTLELS